MITFKGNTLVINNQLISLPIRIKEILIIEDLVIVALGFDANLDCGYIDTWTKQVDDKWNELHSNFHGPTLYCFDMLGNKIWGLSSQGFVNIAKLDQELMKNDLRVQRWISNNADKKNVFIVQNDNRLIVDYKTGEVYQSYEMR